MAPSSLPKLECSGITKKKARCKHFIRSNESVWHCQWHKTDITTQQKAEEEADSKRCIAITKTTTRCAGRNVAGGHCNFHKPKIVETVEATVSGASNATSEVHTRRTRSNNAGTAPAQAPSAVPRGQRITRRLTARVSATASRTATPGVQEIPSISTAAQRVDNGAQETINNATPSVGDKPSTSTSDQRVNEAAQEASKKATPRAEEPSSTSTTDQRVDNGAQESSNNATITMTSTIEHSEEDASGTPQPSSHVLRKLTSPLVAVLTIAAMIAAP